MAQHRFRFIVFDYDGTLADSQQVIVDAMAVAFGELGIPAPEPEAVRRIVGLKLEEAIACLLPELTSEPEVLRAAGCYREAVWAMRTQPHYDEPLFPGVRELLAELRKPGIRLGIATGKNRRGLDHGLQRHGLASHFSVLKTADDGPGKPHPAILQDAMTEIGAMPEETIVIGDTSYDMAMARAAGAAALGVGWGYHGREDLLAAGANMIVERIAEVLTALQSIDGDRLEAI